jgi:hypothetical protein
MRPGLALGGYVSWSAYDNRRLAAVQAYLGCIGPCSRAEEVQKLVHNGLGAGHPPAHHVNDHRAKKASARLRRDSQ